jgi:tetratricopeptide (TPR) repeat protein
MSLPRVAIRSTVVLTFLAFAIAAAEPDLETLMQNGHWKRARVLAEAGYNTHPNDARAAWLLSRVRHQFQDGDDGVKYAELAIRLDPKVGAYHRALYEAYMDQIQKAAVFTRLGMIHKMRAELDTAALLAPKDPDTLTLEIVHLVNAPAMAGGDKKKAAEIANEMVKSDAAAGYLALARIARAEKEEGKLEGLYQKTVESDPKRYEARMALAAFYSAAPHQNFAAMEQHARAALDLNPDRIGAYRWLAFALASQKRFDEMSKVLARAEAAVPDDLSPFVFAARAMLGGGFELPKAETYLKKYLTETKEPEAGAPPFAGAHWSLGLVYEKEGRRAEAKSELQTAVRLKPDFEPAKNDLKRFQ